MKLPKARKLPSGSWYTRVTVNGEVYNITRATAKECEREAAAIKSGAKHATTAKDSRLLYDVVDEYINSRSAVLSPSTCRGYRQIQRNNVQQLMQMQVGQIDSTVAQRAINAEAKVHSAKTVKNVGSLICSALNEICGIQIKLKYPQLVEPEHNFIHEEDIPSFLAGIKDYKHELIILCCLHGLRCSEAMALRRCDIDTESHVIHVRGAAVRDENEMLVYKKETKTKTSRRDVPILIPRLLEIVPDIPADERLFDGSCGTDIYHAVQRGCKRAGIPQVSVHDLRRTFASLCAGRIDEKICQELGGWHDLYTMRKIYQQVSPAKYESAISELRNIFCYENVMTEDNPSK